MSSEPPKQMMSTHRAILVAFTFSLVALLLIGSSSWNDSPSYDEPEHLTAGFTYRGFGLLSMNPVHPPLVKELAGLSLQQFSSQPPLKTWWLLDTGASTMEMFSGEFVAPQTLTRIARGPMILLASGFVGLFFLLLRQRHGDRVAIMASAMLALSPTFLAHAPLVHTDVAASLMSFLSLWFLADYLSHAPDYGKATAFAVVSGTAVLVKFSCLVLCPIYLLSITCVRERAKRWFHVPLVALVVLSLIYAVYAPHRTSSTYHREYLISHLSHKDSVGVKLAHRYSAGTLQPWCWFATGVLLQGSQVRTGSPTPGYLNGRVYYGGDWRYFPTVLLTKVPVALWLLGVLSLGGLRGRMNTEMKLYAGFAGSYFLLATQSGLNIGIRHLLPIFPPLLVLAAIGLDASLTRERKPWYRRGVMGLFLVLLVGTLSSWPNYLSHFNVVTGGKVPVVDSNYDWGTDLYRLSQKAEEKNWDPLHVSYFGGIPARLYLGERCRELKLASPPTSGWVAVSQSLYLPLMEGDDSSLPTTLRDARETMRRWFSAQTEVGTVGTFVILKVGD